MKKIIKLTSLLVLFVMVFVMSSCDIIDDAGGTTNQDKTEILELVKSQIGNIEGCSKVVLEMVIMNKNTKVGYTVQTYSISTEVLLKEEKYTLNKDPYGELYECNERSVVLSKDEASLKLKIADTIKGTSFIKEGYSVSYSKNFSRLYGYLNAEAAKTILGLDNLDVTNISDVVIDVKCLNGKITNYDLSYKLEGNDITITANYTY